MHAPRPLELSTFGDPGDPLVALDGDEGSRQVQYLRCYLHDLGARAVMIEPNYFDRDYLSEFTAFYATSSAGYPNICRRVHYFAADITRERFEMAVGGDRESLLELEHSYLGHVILRPIPGAPIGRTVLKVYADDQGISAGTPRVMEPARRYEAHVAGVTLPVSGLAWQQQDSAVGSCATVALWSMLHSSAFDDHHAIPATAQITASAHWAAPNGNRVFPATAGLHISQMLEVIKGHNLAPVVISGDQHPDDEFSRARFCTLVGSFVRSGYPVLVNGWLEEDERSPHAVCIVGFRTPALATVPDGEAMLADENLEVVYVHDDNLGPNARFRIDDSRGSVSLVPEAPPPRGAGAWPTQNPTQTYHPITPTEIVVAVHQELRTDPLELQRAAIEYASWLPSALEHEANERGVLESTGMIVGSRFIRLREYVEDVLAVTLRERPPEVLSQARLAIWEQVAPMSLHIGLVRVSLGTQPMMDILFDTSDSDRHLRPAAYVAYQPQVPWALARWRTLIEERIDLGRLVRAW